MRQSGSDPKIASAYQTRATAYAQTKEWEKVISDCNEAIRLDPKDAWTYGWRANAYSKKGERNKAIADCKEAIRLDPKGAGFWKIHS